MCIINLDYFHPERRLDGSRLFERQPRSLEKLLIGTLRSNPINSEAQLHDRAYQKQTLRWIGPLCKHFSGIMVTTRLWKVVRHAGRQKSLAGFTCTPWHDFVMQSDFAGVEIVGFARSQNAFPGVDWWHGGKSELRHQHALCVRYYLISFILSKPGPTSLTNRDKGYVEML